jgi:hypothetical protein
MGAQHWNTMADRLRGSVQGLVDAMTRGGLGTDKFSSQISDGHKLIDELRLFSSTCTSTYDANACKTKFNSLNDRCCSYSSSVKSKVEGAKLGEPFNSDILRAQSELCTQCKACEADIKAQGEPTVGEKISQKMSDIGHAISEGLGLSKEKDNKASTTTTTTTTKAVGVAPVAPAEPAAIKTSQYQAKQNFGASSGPGSAMAPTTYSSQTTTTQSSVHPSTTGTQQWSH